MAQTLFDSQDGILLFIMFVECLFPRPWKLFLIKEHILTASKRDFGFDFANLNHFLVITILIILGQSLKNSARYCTNFETSLLFMITIPLYFMYHLSALPGISKQSYYKLLWRITQNNYWFAFYMHHLSNNFYNKGYGIIKSGQIFITKLSQNKWYSPSI